MSRSTPYRNNLKKILRKKGLTYKMLAKLMGEPQLVNSIKNWANQRNQPSEKNVKLVCSSLGIERKRLLYFPEEIY